MVSAIENKLTAHPLTECGDKQQQQLLYKAHLEIIHAQGVGMAARGMCHQQFIAIADQYVALFVLAEINFFLLAGNMSRTKSARS